MNNILLATNLGLKSQYALERALLIARMHTSALHVVHVAAKAAEVAEDELRQQVDTAIAFLEAELSDDFGSGFKPASFKSVSGDPVPAIVAEAESCGANLMVVGLTEKPQGRGSIDGTMLERLLMRSVRPAIVVKSRPSRHYESVLVGLDLSMSSRHAFEAALKVAPTADFTIAHADEGESETGATRDRLVQTTRECLAAARRQVGVHEGAVDILIENGPVSDVLVRCAGRCAPDLVAFGKHNRGMSHGPYIGSGARGVLEQLEADMLVVPPGD